MKWPKTSISEFLTQVWREEAIDSTKSYRLLGARWYGEGLFTKAVKIGQEIRAKSLFQVKEGDFIFNRLFAWKGSFAIATHEDDGAYVSNEFPCFVANGKQVDPMFLLWYFRQNKIWTQAYGLSTGATPTSRNRLKEAPFLSMNIPLPPLNEQRRIVARIEELALQKEEARVLRKRSAEEAGALVAAYLNRHFGDPYKGITHNKGKNEWRRIGEVADDVADGPHVTPSYVTEGVPFITVQNITTGRIQFRNNKFITPEDHRKFQDRAKAEKGDVLISKDGTIGVPCFVATDREFSFFVSVALIKPKRGIIDGEYLAWVIRSPYMQNRIIVRSRGDMIRHLVLREIRDLIVPIPRIAEQRQIVAELDALQAQVDELKYLQAESAAELDALLPSILDRAFKGEL